MNVLLLVKTGLAQRVSVWLAIAIACFCAPLIHAVAGENPAARAPDMFRGEELLYDVSFWLFKSAAHARLVLKKEGDTYVAALEAQTSGFIGFVTRNLKEYMTSTMRFDSRRGCFQPMTYQEVFTQGERTRKRTVTFNHDKRVFTVTYEGTGVKKKSVTKKLFKPDCDDLLTAFYNVRMGYYADARRGTRFPISIYTKEKPSTMQVSFPEESSIPSKNPCNGTHYVIVTLDKDLTSIASRELNGWLSKDLVPLSGTVEDAYLFGDLSIMLKERRVLSK
jgi:hypothetical protein